MVAKISRKDKRVKQCPNLGCGRNQKKFHFNADDIYCTECKCGLVFACSKCGRKIEDEGPSHTLCELCKASRDDRWANVEKAATALGGAAALAGVKTAAKTILKKG